MVEQLALFNQAPEVRPVEKIDPSRESWRVAHPSVAVMACIPDDDTFAVPGVFVVTLDGRHVTTITGLTGAAVHSWSRDGFVLTEA